MNKELQELGLEDKEIEVYLAILEIGQGNVLDISRKAQIPRATIYGILEKLLAENLISSVIKGKRRYYLAEDPEKIRHKVQERERKISHLIPDLRKLYLASTDRPVIRVYEGARGIVAMLKDVVDSTSESGKYDVILNSRDEFAVLGEDYHRHVASRIKKKIQIRIISEISEFTKDWDKTQREMLRQVKFLPRGQHFSVSYHIYGNKVSMFSLQGPIVGVIIENKEIADMERLQFEYMWKGLK